MASVRDLVTKAPVCETTSIFGVAGRGPVCIREGDALGAEGTFPALPAG